MLYDGLQLRHVYEANFRFKKWGWVVYRTTYSDEAKWEQFVETFNKHILEDTLGMEGGEEHCQYLDFPVRSDINKYNNATTQQLRADFLEWRASDAPLQEQEFIPEKRSLLERNLRYKFFIRVDEEAMQRLLDVIAAGEDSDMWPTGWVDLVSANWPEGEEGEFDLQEGHPPFEGLTTLNIGFQRVWITDLYPEYWENLSLEPFKHYKRPPRLPHNDPNDYSEDEREVEKQLLSLERRYQNDHKDEPEL